MRCRVGGSLMGYKVANDFMDNGPAMTTAEWKAMVVLANDANDVTRVTYNPVTSEKIMQRIRLAPKAWTNLRGDLVRKGYLEVVEAGRKGSCAKYRIPTYEQMGHLAGDESEPIRHPAGDENAECVTQEVPPTYYNHLLNQPLTQAGAVAQAPDKSVAPSKTGSFAEVRAVAPTSNTGSSKPKAAAKPKRRKDYPSNAERDTKWRAQIVAADVDELDDVLDTNGHGKSARRMSSFRLGFGTRGSVPDELRPQYVRHAYLYLLKDVAETDSGHLDELMYPLDTNVKAGPLPDKWDHTEHVPAGETAASFSARMVQVAASMPPEQLGPWAAEIEDFLPGLWYEKRHEAREQVATQGLPLEIETTASLAVRLMIQHYANKPRPKWPAEVVPPSMRTVASITEAPSWAA